MTVSKRLWRGGLVGSGNESDTDGAADEVNRVVQENLDVYRASMDRLREDVSQENQVAFDYRGRLVYELLQNADDALSGQTTNDDRALFRLTDDALWVALLRWPINRHD